MMTEMVCIEIKGSVAIITLNRPKSMNALSVDLMRQLTLAFRDLQKNKEISAAIITGAGKAFCAGLDLNELTEKGLDAFVLSGNIDIESAILEFDRPIIGAINGVAATGGFELALWCDILIASNEARFADTHARVGLVPGWGLSQRLSRLIGVNRARELSFTGNFLAAEKAERWGLVNRVVEPDELMPVCLELAQTMSSCDRETLIRYKRIINHGYEMSLGSAMEYEQLAMDLHATSKTGADIASAKTATMERGREQK